MPFIFININARVLFLMDITVVLLSFLTYAESLEPNRLPSATQTLVINYTPRYLSVRARLA